MQNDFKNDIRSHLRPEVDLNTKLVIMGDFNIPVNDANSHFVAFMETLFKCQQHIRQSTTDSGSILDLVFTNCATFCDVIEAYKTDHQLIYSALDIYSFPDDSLSSNHF